MTLAFANRNDFVFQSISLSNFLRDHEDFIRSTANEPRIEVPNFSSNGEFELPELYLSRVERIID